MSVQLGYVSGQRGAGLGAREWHAKERRAKDWRPQFRLRPGQDDALIEWLSSLAPRRRSAAIRDALYQHLAVREEVGAGGEWSEDPELAAALDALF